MIMIRLFYPDISYLTNFLLNSRKVNKTGSPCFSSKAFKIINKGLIQKTFNCSKFTMETLNKFEIC